jgi:hypothetical protein
VRALRLLTEFLEASMAAECGGTTVGFGGSRGKGLFPLPTQVNQLFKSAAVVADGKPAVLLTLLKKRRPAGKKFGR